MVEKHEHEIERLWYIPPRPEVPRGRLVYSLDFVLAAIQGCAADPQRLRRTTGWLLVMPRHIEPEADQRLVLDTLKPVLPPQRIRGGEMILPTPPAAESGSADR